MRTPFAEAVVCSPAAPRLTALPQSDPSRAPFVPPTLRLVRPTAAVIRRIHGPTLVDPRNAASAAESADLSAFSIDGNSTKTGLTRAAFTALLKSNFDNLCRYAARLLPRGEEAENAEDIVQDVFVILWERRAEWTTSGNAQAYLYRATRNRALDVIKHRKVVDSWRKEQAASQRDWLWLTEQPDADLRRDELDVAYRNALGKLPRRRTQMFLMSRKHDMTYEEIAACFQISPKTVEKHMSRAFSDLRKELLPLLDDQRN